LNDKFKYGNVMLVPKLEKVIVNMRLGDCKDNTKAMESAVKELEQITGQKAIITKARKSVSNFKVRKGMDIGAKVTLRKDRMYEFADKLIKHRDPAQSVTSGASAHRPSTAEAIMRSASRSS
jgi:large subunit ribosomal protein L5